MFGPTLGLFEPVPGQDGNVQLGPCGETDDPSGQSLAICGQATGEVT